MVFENARGFLGWLDFRVFSPGNIFSIDASHFPPDESGFQIWSNTSRKGYDSVCICVSVF